MASSASRNALEPVVATAGESMSTPLSLSDTKPIKICVAGSGAIGGTLAVRLALAGHNVSVIARGAHLDAIRSSGLQLVEAASPSQAPLIADVKAADRAAFGVQDVVFVSVKAHGMKAMLPLLAPLIGRDTIVVPTINGVPWWYFQGEGGPFDGETIAAVDPDGALLRALPWRHIVGCVVYIAAHVEGPGVIVTTGTNRLVLGEPSHQLSLRLAALCHYLDAAGVQAEPSERIRDAIWVKLMANLATNPLSVVTEATLDQLHGDKGLIAIIRKVMQETLSAGRAYGMQAEVDIDHLLAMGRELGPFKTSMLQDFERGHPLELAAIGDAAVELAARYDIPMPATRQLLALARFRSRQRMTKP